MRRIALFAVLALAAVLVPAALAKGPSEAQISGPGMGKPIHFGGGPGGVEPGGGGPPGFASLVDGLGFFPSVFGQQPNPMLPGRPSGDLGPRYTVRYTVPGPDGSTIVKQDLYPYAAGGPVVYTKPNQPVFPGGGVSTAGGWYRALDSVKPLLVDRGLPAAAPSGGRNVFGWVVALAAILAAGALVALALTRVRRRPRPSLA